MSIKRLMFNCNSDRNSPSILKLPTASRIAPVSSSDQSATFLFSSTLASAKIFSARLFPIPKI
jgi:hypothetical protein